MLIRHLDGTRRRDLRATVADPDATVADLAAALEPDRRAGPLLVDGRRVAPATPLDRAGIAHGATIERPPGPDDPPPPPPSGPLAPGEPVAVAVAVTAGPDAGRVVHLGPGTHPIGRADAAPGLGGVRLVDPTVSGHHAHLHVSAAGAASVTDGGSTNGTWVGPDALAHPTPVAPGTEVRVGASRVVVGHEVAWPASPIGVGRGADLVGSARTRPWHRPPRPASPASPAPVALPPEPAAPPPVSPVGVVAVVASVAAGGAAVVLLHSWSYAAFALLGPVLVVANALDARRRRRTHRRRARRRRTRELRALADALDQAREREVARRRAVAPGPAAAVAAVTAPSTGLWERRPDHPDARTVCVGVGPVRWEPPTTPADASGARQADVAAVVLDHAVLHDAPVALRLEPGRPVAVVGPLEVGRALVRSVLVQAVVEHGPADLRVAVLAAPDHAAAWDWCAWLPHVADPEVGCLLAGSEAAGAAVASALVPPPDEAAGRAADAGDPFGRATVVVVDDPGALGARRSAARSLLRLAADAGSGLVPVVLVDRAEEVPAACRTVLTVDAAGTLVADELAAGPSVVVGTAEDVAREVARGLAGFDDPELDDPTRDLPASVALADLLGGEQLTAAGTVAAWRAAGTDPPPRAVLGVSADGPFVVDLAADGPHALVAGTTGAGKSELLRTLVASMAAASSPRHLTFLLIDFKGGSAFDACARLPHVTGLVTDLDDHLATRALQCLDAELRHREERLHAAGAEDLAELRRRSPHGEPLPRLVVVVDEFATLAAELPDFVDSLVGVAQRGRSLGVHLVLATQRPSGAVSERIRANTALRVALRVHDAADSTDVVDVPGAATLPRRLPGRALVRLGPGELATVQVARSTGPATADASADDAATRRPRAPVTVHHLGVPHHAPDAAVGRVGGDDAPAGGRTDLDLLVDACAAAWGSLHEPAPRRPWPEPLPLQLDGPELAPPGPRLVVGRADRPDRQRHEPWAWELDDGPLLAVGLPGSGTTTLAATAVLAAAGWEPGGCHVHVIDLGAGALAPLAGLPHVGAVIAADDTERQRRLLADLADDLARRRAAPSRRGTAPSEPRRLVVVDGLGAFRARWPDLDPTGTWDHLLAVVADGSALGVHVLLTAEGVASAPHRIVAACRQRLVFRLGERADHAAFGIPASAVPDLPPGRAVAAEGALLVQVARPPDGLAAAVARRAGQAAEAATPAAGAAPVGRLPDLVGPEDLGPATVGADGSLAVPLGIADHGLVPALLRLGPGGHAVVAGPPRSGRTTALEVVGRAAAAAGVAVVAVAAGSGAGAWVEAGVEHRAPTEDLTDLLERVGPLLVLVDDADRTADDHPVLARLAADRRPERHVVAAARSDRLRSAYGHWTRELRADRVGLLLAPDPDLDGDLLGARVPRHLVAGLPPGRGWGCGTSPEGLVQVAVARGDAVSDEATSCNDPFP